MFAQDPAYFFYQNKHMHRNNRHTDDIPHFTTKWMCEAAKCYGSVKAIFGMVHKIQDFAPLPPKVMFKVFDSVIKPILVYGSDVWGHRNTDLESISKVMLRSCRCILNVKATTSNIIVHGECGVLPPSVQRTTSVLSFINRKAKSTYQWPHL